LKFQKLQTGPFSPSSSLPACSAPRRRCSAPSPPWRASPATSCLQNRSTRRAAPLHRFHPSRWSLHRLATRPRDHRRSPPRRHRGWLAAVPQDPNSRAHQHYKKPRNPFPSSFRLFLASTLQNTAAVQTERRRAELTVELIAPVLLRSTQPLH